MIDELTPADWFALDYCAPRGIPLSVFLGRVVYAGDQMWLERDTQAALEWHVAQKRLCSGCNLPREETMGKEGDREYEVTSTRCWACEALDAGMNEFKESGASGSGVYWTVKEKRGDVELTG